MPGCCDKKQHNFVNSMDIAIKLSTLVIKRKVTTVQNCNSC